MYHQCTMEFSEWIVMELEKRGWSRSEAARRGDISPSMFDKVINGHAKPGVRFIEGIAKAFKISAAEVMMHVSGQSKLDPWVEEMNYKLKLIPPGLRGVASSFINSLLEGSEETNQKPKTKRKESTL
jgi:transcriptional regulator with XRE-family HTH domain